MSTKAIGAGLAALAAAAALATTGTAQTAPTTLHLVGHAQKGVGFFPKGRPRPGDRVGFGDRVSGDDTGTDTGACTVVRQRVLCSIEAQLSKGTLSLQGLLPQRSNNHPVAITGGTGAYAGARGVARVTDTNATTTTIDITLMP
jgi:hypothetical protein